MDPGITVRDLDRNAGNGMVGRRSYIDRTYNSISVDNMFSFGLIQLPKGCNTSYAMA